MWAGDTQGADDWCCSPLESPAVAGIGDAKIPRVRIELPAPSWPCVGNDNLSFVAQILFVSGAAKPFLHHKIIIKLDWENDSWDESNDQYPQLLVFNRICHIIQRIKFLLH
jgi:hypothetical protein